MSITNTPLKETVIRYCIGQFLSRVVTFREIYYSQFKRFSKSNWIVTRKIIIEMILDYKKYKNDNYFWMKNYHGYVLEPCPGILSSKFSIYNYFPKHISVDLFVIKPVTLHSTQKNITDNEAQ